MVYGESHRSGAHEEVSHVGFGKISKLDILIACGTSVVLFLNEITVTASNFEITFVLEKHVVEDDVLFTNHLVGK